MISLSEEIEFCCFRFPGGCSDQSRGNKENPFTYIWRMPVEQICQKTILGQEPGYATLPILISCFLHPMEACEDWRGRPATMRSFSSFEGLRKETWRATTKLGMQLAFGNPWEVVLFAPRVTYTQEWHDRRYRRHIPCHEGNENF